MTEKIVVSSVLATLASICFVAGVALLTAEGGANTYGTSEKSSIDDRASYKYQN